METQIESVVILQPGVLGNIPVTEAETNPNNLCQSCNGPVAPEDQDEMAELPMHKACADARTKAMDADYEREPEPEVSPEPVADSAPKPLFDHDSPEYEDSLTERLRDTVPAYLARYEAQKREARDVSEMKDLMVLDLAKKKAILLGKGGRGSEWGPYVESLKLKIRTVDRWIERKLDNVELPQWVMDRLRATKHADPVPDPAPAREAESEELKQSIGVKGNRFECVFPVTHDEQLELDVLLNVVSAEETKQLFLEALRKAAGARTSSNELSDLIARARKRRESLSFLDKEEKIV